MRNDKQRICVYTRKIKNNVSAIYTLLDKLLCRSDMSFDIQIGDEYFNFYTPLSFEEKVEQSNSRHKLIKFLIQDALNCLASTVGDDEEYWEIEPWRNIKGLVSGADPADHQIEIIKEDVKIVDLDEQGNPIKAKPLNMDSIYVQWQDQSKFNLEDQNE